MSAHASRNVRLAFGANSLWYRFLDDYVTLRNQKPPAHAMTSC
jgi:hypothetical protein